jgi:glycerophosphoryl diester phosphodiesterase
LPYGLFSVPASLDDLTAVQRGFFAPAREGIAVARLRPFELQGHRGARGLKPENTLPSFEAAFDIGVSTVETDLHLTRDSVPVLFHDPEVSERHCRRVAGRDVVAPEARPAVSTLTLTELRSYRADLNPDPRRFPEQNASPTPVAQLYAAENGLEVYTPPTLADLFAFTAAYAGELGIRAGKTDAQRATARRVCFDLELKRVPFRPETIGDRFDGKNPGLFEQRVVACVREAGVLQRTAMRSFDHRSVRAVGRLEPALLTGILIAETAPVSPGGLAREVGAMTYCPDFQFVDEMLVQQAHAEGLCIIPWTVNAAADWRRLIDWGVDGITTDFPAGLAALLEREGLVF